MYMDIQLEDRLRSIERKLDENTAILKKIRRSQRMAAATKLLYWVVIIVLGIVSISFVKSYVTGLHDAYGLGGENGEGGNQYAELLKNFRQ